MMVKRAMHCASGTCRVHYVNESVGFCFCRRPIGVRAVCDRTYDERMSVRQPASTTRYVAKQVVVYLVLGAMINVVVAWIFVCCPFSSVIPVPLSNQDAAAAMPVHSAPAEAPLISVMGSREAARGRTRYLLFAFHIEETEDGTIRYANQLSVWQTGWPYHSMRGWVGVGRTPSEIGTHGLWRVRWTKWFADSPLGARGLPLVPLWPGFAIDSLLYASASWLLINIAWIPGRIRRRIRAHRGQCVGCGYDLRGSREIRGIRGRGQNSDQNRCPECGRVS